MSQLPNTYDEVPYPAASFPQTHPVKLATMARFFGLTPADPAQCRLLELGSADGSNILPLAQAYPQSTFHGIDLSTRQVEAGQKAIAAAGLSNVTLEHKNILDFPIGEQKYDYIVVHGIYSWVPAPVRDKILEISRKCLTENGVAYISYNCFPGWKMRGMVRDMALFHSAQFPDIATKVAQTRALVKFLADSVPTEGNPYGQFIKNELELMKGWQDSYLRHDLLEEENQPFYFHEFVRTAHDHGLQYLGETEISTMLASGFPQTVQETLQRIGRNIIATEQYMDFVRNRTFRQTLLVPADTKITRAVDPRMLTGFWFSTSLRAVSAEPNMAAGHKEEFKGPAGAVTTENSLVKIALSILGRAAPSQVSFADLIQEIRANVLGEVTAIRPAEVIQHEEAGLAQQLMAFITRGMVEATAFAFPSVVPAGERPVVSPLARYQALNSRNVPNHRHVPLGVDVFSRHLLSLLDGTKDRPALVQAMVAKVKEGVLTVQHDGKPVTDDAILVRILEPRVLGTLDQISRMGLIVPSN